MRKERFGIVEDIEVIHRDKYGNIKSKHGINKGVIHRLLCRLGLRHNTLMYYGFLNLCNLSGYGLTGTQYRYLQIGTGNTAANPEDLALGTPKGVRKSATITTLKTNASATVNDTVQFVYTFSQANDGTLTGTDAICEIGVFHTSTGDNVMLFRIVYSPVDSCNWDAGDTLQITAKCQFIQGS